MAIPAFSFHHAAINVPDLDQAVSWYNRVLGFEVEKSFEIPPAKARVAMVRNGPLRFEIFETREARPLPDERRLPITDLQTHGNKHAAFRVESLDAFIEAMNALEVEVVFVVREAFGSGCFIRDPFGNLIEFVEELNH